MNQRELLLAARLGLDLERDAIGRRPRTTGLVERMIDGPAGLHVVVGPCGSGKTTLLRAARRALSRRGVRVRTDMRSLSSRSPIDSLFARGLDLDRAIARLARAGLGAADRMLGPADRLSSGEQARLRLLLAMSEGSALVLDEFASSLDRLAARGIATMVARWARRPGRRVILATHHEDLLPFLAPCAVVRLDPSCEARAGVLEGPASHPLDEIVIEPGTRSELDSLLVHHYRAGRPRVVVGILRAVDRGVEPPALCGVLCASMPVLNGRWRDLAWPARFTTGSKRARALRINRELRCISRVVVDPRYRGLGLARRLVRSYLDAPLTPCTESITALGRAARFFERAGMTPYRLSPALRDARLLDALEHVGLDPTDLCRPGKALARIRSSAARSFVERELQRWARASRAGGPARDRDALLVLRRAARTLAGAPVAFAHSTPPTHTIT